jgi:hypothetical protein
MQPGKEHENTSRALVATHLTVENPEELGGQDDVFRPDQDSCLDLVFFHFEPTYRGVYVGKAVPVRGRDCGWYGWSYETMTGDGMTLIPGEGSQKLLVPLVQTWSTEFKRMCNTLMLVTSR